MSVSRQLSLVKGAERFVFRHQAGQETEVIDASAVLAVAPASVFGWFDAAVLGYQMGRRFGDGARSRDSRALRSFVAAC